MAEEPQNISPVEPDSKPDELPPLEAQPVSGAVVSSDDITPVKIEEATDEVKPQTPIVTSDKISGKKLKFPKPDQLFPNFLRKHLGGTARPLGILVIIVAIGLISFGGWFYAHKTSITKTGIVRFTAQTVAFKVVSTSPSDNQLNVALNSPVTITFSQPVNPQQLQGNLFLTPNVAGTFSQGKTSDQVVFTPTVPFTQGTKVQVMLNGTYQSTRGSKLGADFAYGFTTVLPSDGVTFQDSNNLYATVSSAETGQKEVYTLIFGSGVAPGVNVTLYKSDMNQLLSSLIYNNTTTDGYTYPTFADPPIDTSSMQLINTQKGLNNNSNYAVSQTNGIYLALATDAQGNQLGNVWIDYSDFGVIARQDDQKIVLDAQNLSTSSDISASATVYNLENSVNQITQATVDGLTTISLAYSPSADVVVASDGTSQALVPLSILESQGDIRVDQNLTTAQTIFGVTDRPTYSTTDTVRYSGYIRSNQDAQYGPTTATLLHLYVAFYPGGTPFASFTAQPDSNGMFSGSFAVNPSWLGSDSSDQFQIYSASPDGVPTNDAEVAGFTVNSQPNPTTNITVNFSKSSYMPTDTVQAMISAVNANGSPLANATVDVHTFSEDYFENDPTANLNDFNNAGAELDNSPATVQLNSNGQATYLVNVHNLPDDGSSQLVTVQANLHGATSGAAGGASAIVHQGNGELSFGPGRNVVSTSGTIIGRVYASDLNGNPLANTTVNYSVSESGSTSSLSSGNVTTDSKGYAEISTTVPASAQEGDALELDAWVSDAQNNKIEASNYYYVSNSSGTDDTSGAALEDLDISGSPSNISVGQTVNLVINSPDALNAMITMDRGRIYNPKMVNLTQGNNNFSFTVTNELAPSFTLTINYFDNGVYHSEGVQFEVSNPAKQAALSITPASGPNVTANSPTSIQIAAKDSLGNPLSTDLIVDIVSENAFNLYNPTVPDMYTSLYGTLPIMTSSSSSLSSIGSGGGGRCGGGGFGVGNFTNPIGTTLLWQPEVITNASGNATVNFTPPKGQWQINVYSMNGSNIVGSASSTITAN